MATKIHPLDAETCDVCGGITFAWVNPCKRCTAMRRINERAIANFDTARTEQEAQEWYWVVSDSFDLWKS